MNLKKSILSFMAAGAILAGSFGGVMAQDDSASQTTTVQVNTVVAFDAYFCKATTNFGTVSLSSSTVANEAARTKTGTTTICYLDTTHQRKSFKTTLQAGAFVRSGGGSISNSQLSIKHVENPQQGQWSSGLPTNSDGKCGPFTGTNRPCVGDIAGRNNNGTTSVPDSGADWLGVGTLNNQLQVSYAYEGAGTAGTRYMSEPGAVNDNRLNNGSYHDIDLQLIVPQNTIGGTYTGSLNLYVYMNAAP